MLRAPGDGLELQLAQWPGPEPAVVALHGITANCRCWDTIAQGMRGARRLLALDLRGRGRSDKPDQGYSPGQHCRDLDAVLEHLGLERVVLMGHSLGAYISLIYAATRPQRAAGLILVDGGGILSQEQWAQVAAGIAPSLERLDKVFPSFEDMMAQVRRAPHLQPWNQALEDYYRYDCQEVPGGIMASTSAATTAQDRAGLHQMDVGRFYPRLSCPVLVLRATEGVMAPEQLVLPPDAAERLRGDLPQAQWRDLAGLNHFSIIFQPHAARDQAIREFLAA
jgi:pimeloyl-ACP methyl ester carboxylesterase